MTERDPTAPRREPSPGGGAAATAASAGKMPAEFQPTVRTDALSEGEARNPDPLVALDFHRRVAAKLLRDGQAERAFQEVWRAADQLRIDGRLAATLCDLATTREQRLKAARALEAALPRALAGSGDEIRYRLGRLYLSLGEADQARKHLMAATALGTSRWRSLCALEECHIRSGDVQGAAGALLGRAEEATRGGHARAAVRAYLAAADLQLGPLQRPKEAAEAALKAAQLAAGVGIQGAHYRARVTLAHALIAAKAPVDRIGPALGDLASAGRAAGRTAEARALASRLAKECGLKGPSPTGEHGALSDPGLESRLIGRGAWEDLAALYRAQAERAQDSRDRAAALTRLAEVLEDELGEKADAAEAYGEVVCLTGEESALSAQLRLLSSLGETAALREAIETAVSFAPTAAARVSALVWRAEALAAEGKKAEAAVDFEAALQGAPSDLRALAGLAECRGDAATIDRLRRVWPTLPPGSPGRAGWGRRLARLLEWPLHEEAAARMVWHEVLLESPTDSEASGRLLELARAAGDLEEEVNVLKRRLVVEKSGNAGRAMRHELALCLEKLGRREESLQLWREAARVDPGDPAAHLAIAERCERSGMIADAAAALENAAAATAAPAERAALFQRLARLHREGLADERKAGSYEERARALLASLGPEGNGPRTIPEMPAVDAPRRHTRPRTVTIPEAKPGGKAGRRFTAERIKLISQVEAQPLEPAGYREIAQRFGEADDLPRAALFEEIARALEGDARANPSAPRVTLAHRELMLLKHPGFRSAAGELLELIGLTLCAFDVQDSKETGVLRPFSPHESKGAARAADALFAAVRVLGVRAPEVSVSMHGAPLRPVNTEPARIVVGQAAIDDAIPEAQLRFFAGRTLFCFRPEVMALRLIAHGRLQLLVELSYRIACDEAPPTDEAKKLAAKLPRKARPRVRALYESLEKRHADWKEISDAARHMANRAGLIVAGGVAPAVAALRAKQRSEGDLVDLLRFAVSDGYLALRARR